MSTRPPLAFEASTWTPDGLAMIKALGLALTKRQREVLHLMATAEDSEDGLLVYERGRGYVGLEPISGCTFYALLRACAIRHIDGEPGGFEIYVINETGRKLAAASLETDPQTEPSREDGGRNS